MDKGHLNRHLSVNHFMQHIMGDGQQSQGGAGVNKIFCTPDEIDMLRRCGMQQGQGACFPE